MDRVDVPEELNQLTHQVIGCAIEVHRTLDPGLLESVYESALCHELELANIRYTQQVSFTGQYKGKPLPQQRLDLLIENQLILELKAIRAIEDNHLAQLTSYLYLANKPLGLLINFHAPTIKKGTYRRINSKALP